MKASTRFAGSILATLAVLQAASAYGAVVPGQKAPALDLQQVLQTPDGSQSTWETLRGKVVVLEFWATWCPTCVKSIPHFDELADELKGKPVEFISVTDEDPGTVKEFLARHPIRGCVGLNPTGSMFKAYGIEGRPITFVVRPDGVIDSVICPYATPFPLHAQNLLNLIEGRQSGLVSSRVVFAGEVHDESGRPVAGVSVRANGMTSEDSSWRIGDTITDANGRFTIDKQIPPADVNQNPIRIEFIHPNYVHGRLEDLRVLSADEQTHLHVTMLEGNTIAGAVLDSNGRPVPRAIVLALFGRALPDQQSARTDSEGRFVVRGLPSQAVNLRAFSPAAPSSIQTGTAAVDLKSSVRSATIHVLPVVWKRSAARELLGMKLAELDAHSQAQLGLDHPAILVLDSGPNAKCLGYEVHAGDCFWAVDGKNVVTDVAGLCKLIVRQFNATQRGRPVRLICGLHPWGEAFTITSQWDQVQLTDADLKTLRRTSDQQ